MDLSVSFICLINHKVYNYTFPVFEVKNLRHKSFMVLILCGCFHFRSCGLKSFIVILEFSICFNFDTYRHLSNGNCLCGKQNAYLSFVYNKKLIK